MKLTRYLDSALCLGLLTLTIPIAIPALAEPSNFITQIAQSSHSLNLLEQGLVAYEAGRYLEAVTVWEQAEQEFQQKSDRLNRAATLNYLSLAHQELGQWQEAQQAITQSLELLQEQPESSNWAVLAQALNSQGSLQLATGEAEKALET